MVLQEAILDQLSDIQRLLGGLTESSENQREQFKTFTDESTKWRDTMTNRMDNAVGRIAVLEMNVKEMEQTLNKTIMPMLTTHEENRAKAEDNRKWRSGYVAAMSMVIGALIALIGFVAGPFRDLFITLTRFFAGRV